MCGLVFIHEPATDSQGLIRRCRHALERLRHRGPDSQGLWCKDRTVLGHQRLAIIDLDSSRQPMVAPDGQHVLIYNGEVYNYKELRHGLAQRWRFVTKGDTEVLLAGLLLKGTRFLNEIEGMWGLALWNHKERRLLLARDRVGKKPLYYQTGATTDFVCASELPALRSLVTHGWDEDLCSTADYIRYGYYLPGTTAYRDVYEVLPGHVLDWSPGTKPLQSAYWSLPLNTFGGSKRSGQEFLRQQLHRAIARRMTSDVEVGAFLSGGIDSSLLVSIMARELGLTPKTFTIGFSDSTYDERTFARIAAQAFGTDHYEECLDRWDSDRLRQLITNHVGQPFADASLLPTALVSQVASEHVKVALSGDGGDELFSGYQRYQARAILRWYTRLPGTIRKQIGKIIRAIPEPMAHHSRSLIKKAHLFLDVATRQNDETPYIAPLMHSREDLLRLAPDLVHLGHEPPGLARETRLDDIATMMINDALIYLPQDILLKVDRASMAHSIETRAPFLDRELIELAFSFPRDWHRRGHMGKRMLRDTFTSRLPKQLWKRRKQGFGVPLHRWFRGRLGAELENTLHSINTPIQASRVQELLAEHRKGYRDHGYRLWQIFVYLSHHAQQPSH